MAYPVHPRPGTHSTPRAHSSADYKGEERPPHYSTSICCSRGRDVLLFSLFGALAIALTLLVAIQIVSFHERNPISDLFTELRVNVDGDELELFGRKLMVDDGEYFLDIPYSIATPRFQPAQVAPLPGGFSAIHYGNGCPNGFSRTKPAPGINWNPPPLELVPVSEQCHTLNIYRCPNSKSSKQLLPVLVYISEGHWLKRSNANLEPSTTIRRLACAGDGMVVVSINYRMGAYGLFSAPHWPSTQRELALWDIRTALEWAQLNIAHFGGHRAHVTVMARGDGARLVSLLGLLPGTQSLFKRQILLSGSAFMPVLLQPAPFLNRTSSFDAAMRFAIAAKCVDEREWEVVKASRDKTALAQNEMEARKKLDACVATLGHDAIVVADSLIQRSTFLRWPLLSGDSSSAIPSNPFTNIPSTATMIVICTSEKQWTSDAKTEGGHAEDFRKRMDEADDTFRKRLEEAVREEVLERMRRMDDLAGLKYSEEVIRHYVERIGGQGEDPDDLINRIKTDFFLIGPALLEAFVRARLGSARVFALHFRSSTNVSLADAAEVASNLANPWAASQPSCVDDLLFNPTPRGHSAEEQEQKAVRIFAEMITNFVTYGDPNPDGSAGDDFLPTVYQREKANCEDRPRWLNLNNGTIFNGLELLFGHNLLSENAHFWLSGMAKRMGIVHDGDSLCH
uniref:COesterase domain-containing protein n=1 Tax=Globodera pallida TaxID=36090 RepID=A0A183C533_GLOPA